MGNKLLPLIGVVLLCFTSFVAAANTFTVTNGGNTTVGSQTYLRITPSGISTPVQVSVTASPEGVFQLSESSHSFASTDTWQINLIAKQIGKVTLTFVSNNGADYTNPDPVTIIVFVTVGYDSFSFYPGKTVSGTISLGSSPASSLRLSFATSSNSLIIKPNTFTFNADQAPYSLTYTVTSTQPGTYYYYAVAEGTDAPFVYLPTPNASVTIDNRLVYSNPVTTFYTKVGQQTQSVLVSLDVAPDADLTVNIWPSDNTVIPSPASLVFGPTITALSYTLVGNSPTYASITYNFTGTDKDKYALSYLPAISVANRTISKPSFSSLLIGVTSAPYTFYVADAPDPDHPLFLTLSSSDNLIFNPQQLKFHSSSAVATTVITATNATGPSSRKIDFALSGDYAWWFTPLASSYFSISAAIRHVGLSYSWVPSNFPYGKPVRISFTLDNVPPSEFTISFSGAAIAFTPSSITFSNSTGALTQTITLVSSSLGSSRIFFEVSGTDAALVQDIPSIGITVVQYQAPYLSISSPTIGVPMQSKLYVPSPPINGLTVTLSVTPVGSDVTITPSVFTLTSPGYNGGSTEYDFTVLSNSVGAIVVHATMSGPDFEAGLFPAVEDEVVNVYSASFDASQVIIPANPVVNVPITGLVVTLDVAHSTSVTLTPSAATFKFDPPSFKFDPEVNVVCFTVTPTVAPLASETIVFTSSDPVNYVAPSPIVVNNIQQKTFDISQLTGAQTLNVGAPSKAYRVSVNYPPVSPVVLTPASTDGLQFNPSTLTFDANTEYVYLTITPSSLANPNPVVTWSDDSSEFGTPSPLTQLVVAARTLQISSSFPNTEVGLVSQPVVVSTDLVVPGTGVTITPSAPGVTFSPTKATLSGATTFAAFTATYPQWLAPYDSVSIDTQFVLSGDYAGWFSPLSTSTYFYKRSISYSSYGFSVVTKQAPYTLTVTLDTPPEQDITLTFCAPSVVEFTPAALTFGPGQTRAYVQVGATDFLGTSPLSSATVHVDVTGTNAASYSEASDFTVAINTVGSLVLTGFPSGITIGDGGYVFEIYVPFREALPAFTVTPVSEGGLTFTPSSVTFDNLNIHHYISVQASDLVHFAGSSSTETVTFEISGISGVFGTIAPRAVTIFKRSVSYNVPNTYVYVGDVSPGCVTLSYPPSEGQITFTALTTPEFTVVPSVLIFNAKTQTQCFVVSSDFIGSASLGWEVTGTEASFYNSAPSVGYYFASRYIYTSVSSLTVQPGRLNVLTFNVYSIVTNDLTIIPVLPSPLVATPEKVTLKAGETIGYTSFSISGGNMRTTDYNLVSFELSGTDADWYYPPAPVSVYVAAGTISVSGFSDVEVGMPTDPVFVTLSPVTVNGLTITLNSTGGAIFDPPSVTFNPGESTAMVIITPIRTGSSSIEFGLSGPDAWLYGVPSRVINAHQRSISVGLNTPAHQVKQSVQLYLSNPPRNSIEITPISTSVKFDSEKYVFDSKTDSLIISYTPLTCGYVSVTWQLTGEDAGWYNTLNLQPWVPYASCIQVSFDSSSNLLSGVPQSARAYVNAPATFSVHPSAPGCSFEPASFDFTEDILSVPYTITCDVSSVTSSGAGIPIVFTVDGDDAGLIQQPIVDDDIYMVTNILNVPNSLGGVYSGQPYTFEVNLNYPPADEIIVTPIVSNAIISPESLTFGGSAGRLSSGFFTVTPTSPNFVSIRYALSGPGSSSIGLSYSMTEFSVNYGEISWGFSASRVQETYGPYNVILYPPTINGVIFTPSAPGCTFTPSEAAFTHTKDTVSMFVRCDSVGSPYISFEISGDDAIHYSDPGYQQVSILPRTVQISFDTAEPQIFDVNRGMIYLQTPPESGLTITPSAASITFSPATIDVPAGATTVPFTYVGNALGGDIIVWGLSGDDVELYAVPAINSFYVDYRYISPYMPSFGNIYAGSWSNTFSVVLDRAPDSGLTITLYGAGLAFNPTTLEFGSGETGKSFTVKPSASLESRVYFDLSGDDAEYYAQPDSIYFSTSLITPTLDIGNYDQPTIGVESPPLLVYTDQPPTSAVTITFTGPGTFNPSSVTLTPSLSAAKFTFTPSAVGYTTISASVSGDAAVDFSTTWFETYRFFIDRRQFRTMNNFPDLVANVPSSTLSLVVDFAPPTGFQVIPSAPNFVFTPSTLEFTPGMNHAEFTMICSQPTHFNQFPNQFGNLAPTQISWRLQGTDAGWYDTPNNYYVNVLPRDLTINYYSSQYINVPFAIDVATRYPPNTTLVVSPGGNFLFDQQSYTLTPDQPSVIIWATPISDDSGSFKLFYGGDDAALYQPNDDWHGVGVNKWSFIMPNFQGYQYGEWSAPQVIRVSNIPKDEVTLTPTSDYLDFRPQTLTFGPNNPSAQVEILLRKGNNYLRTTSFTIHFWVGGPAAYLFDTPSSATIYMGFNNPPRTFTVFNFPSSLTVGVPATNIVVRIPNHPVDSLVVTPVPHTPHLTFTPASLTFNRTSTDLAASFSVVANHPAQAGYVVFALTGLDAGYYQQYSAYVSIGLRQISFSFQNLVVGTTSQPMLASLPYPTPNGFSFRLSSQSIAFNPDVITFLPNTSTAAFTAVGGTVGNNIPVKAISWGPDADWHNSPSSSISSLTVSARSWALVPGGRSLTPSVPQTIEYAVYDPPVNWLSITPWAPGVTFVPATATLYPNSSSISFSVVGNVGGTNVVVKSLLDGPDAKWYNPISDYSVSVSELSLQADNLGGDINIDLWEQRDVRIRLSGAAVNGITITPTASNLVFDPPAVYIPPGHMYAHCSYTATAPGLSSVKLVVSGPDSLLYYVYQPGGNIRVYPLYLSVSSPPSVLVGSTSAPFTVFARGAATGIQRPNTDAVNVTFLVSPPSAATINPPVATLYPPYSTFQISVTPRIVSDLIAITPVLSGPGAVNYQSFPGSSPNLISFASVKRSFTMTDLFNYLGNTNQRQFVVGELSPYFSVTALSVPSDVSIYLTAPGLQFIPSVLRFTGTYETLFFQILPLTPGLTQITLSLSGTDAPLFNVPSFPNGGTGVSAQLRITHNFVVPSLPSVTIGELSPPLEISIKSPLSSPVVVVPTVPTCASGLGYVTFLPPYFIITPNSTTQKFQYIGNCATFNLGSNYNPVITGASPRQYTTAPTVVSVNWRVTEAGESSPYSLSFTPLTESVLAVNVLPGTFNVQYEALRIGETSTVNISVTVPPRSDVVLTLVANNLNFHPPHVTLFPNTTYAVIEVTPVHADFKDSQNIPFTVDYIISGSNYADYVPPAQTFLGVTKGDAAVVGGICGRSDGAVTRAGAWIVVFMLAILLWQ